MFKTLHDDHNDAKLADSLYSYDYSDLKSHENPFYKASHYFVTNVPSQINGEPPHTLPLPTVIDKCKKAQTEAEFKLITKDLQFSRLYHIDSGLKWTSQAAFEMLRARLSQFGPIPFSSLFYKLQAGKGQSESSLTVRQLDSSWSLLQMVKSKQTS